MTLIGKGTKVPAGLSIGTNCLVCGNISSGYIPREDLGDGKSVLP
jgi:hypothetical protein